MIPDHGTGPSGLASYVSHIPLRGPVYWIFCLLVSLLCFLLSCSVYSFECYQFAPLSIFISGRVNRLVYTCFSPSSILKSQSSTVRINCFLGFRKWSFAFQRHYTNHFRYHCGSRLWLNICSCACSIESLGKGALILDLY